MLVRSPSLHFHATSRFDKALMTVDRRRSMHIRYRGEALNVGAKDALGLSPHILMIDRTRRLLARGDDCAVNTRGEKKAKKGNENACVLDAFAAIHQQ